MKKQQHLIQFGLTFVLVILLNVVAGTLFFRLDFTKYKVFSVSNESRTLVKELQEPLTIKAFFTKDLPAPYNNLIQELRDLLNAYAQVGNKKFNFSIRTISPDIGEDSKEYVSFTEDAKQYQIYPVQVQSYDNDEVKISSVFKGLAIIHGSLVDVVFDLGADLNLEYILTSRIKKMTDKTNALLAYQDKIKVTFFYSSYFQYQEGFDGVVDHIRKVVEDLNMSYFDKYEFKAVIEGDEGTEEWVSKYGLLPVTVNDKDGNPQQEQVDIIVEGGDTHYAISLQYLTVADIGNYITVMTDKILGINTSIGYLADKGTVPYAQNSQYSTNGSMSTANLLSLLSQQYDVRPVQLSSGSIPDDLKTLIIASPTEQFSEYDLFLIDQFLMKGNNLVVFEDSMDGFPVDMGGRQQLQYMPRTTGFEKLLASYGIVIKNSYVMEEKGYTGRSQTETGSILENRYNNFFFVQDKSINTKEKYMLNIAGILLQNVNPLDLSGLTSEQKATVLISSTKDSWEVSENINLEPNMNNKPDDPTKLGTRPLAAIISGHFDSYYKGKEVEMPAAANAGDSLIQSAQPVKQKGLESTEAGNIFVMGSSAAILDHIVDGLGDTPNGRFASNIVDHLSGRDAYAIMKSKGLSFGPLKDMSASSKNFFKILNIAGPVILIGLLGLLLFSLWKNKVQKIKAYYMKTAEEVKE